VGEDRGVGLARVAELGGVDVAQPLLDDGDLRGTPGRARAARVGDQGVEPGHAELGGGERIEGVHEREVLTAEPFQLRGGRAGHGGGPGHGATQIDGRTRRMFPPSTARISSSE